MAQGPPNRRQDRNPDKAPAQKGDTTEKVVFINRCAKVVKGGRRFSFSALIVAGDHDGSVGVGFGKANEVSEAIRKASESAKKSMEKVSLHEDTIPDEEVVEFGGRRVLFDQEKRTKFRKRSAKRRSRLRSRWKKFLSMKTRFRTKWSGNLAAAGFCYGRRRRELV